MYLRQESAECILSTPPKTAEQNIFMVLFNTQKWAKFGIF